MFERLCYKNTRTRIENSYCEKLSHKFRILHIAIKPRANRSINMLRTNTINYVWRFVLNSQQNIIRGSRKIDPGKIAPEKIALGKIAPRKIGT